MRISVVRIISRSLNIGEIDSPIGPDTIKKFILFLSESEQNGIAHLTFHGKYLQTLIESDPSWIEKLRTMSDRKSILLGPWYLMPNDCLASGESLVRNLYYGNKICYRIGNVMKVGYSALNCNNNSQLPQIFNGFNIDTLFVPVTASQHLPREFYWEGADGNKALVISNFVIEGKGPVDYSQLDEILQYLKEEGDTVSGMPVILVEDMDTGTGGTRLSEIINYLKSRENVQVEYISLPDHFWKIKEIATKQSLKTLTREVIPNPRLLLRATAIKCLRIISKNSYAEQELQFYSEPWDFIRLKTVGEHSFGKIEKLWTTLLTLQTITKDCPDNAPDSMRSIRSKYTSVINSIQKVYFESVKQVLSRINLPEIENGRYFSIVNPLPYNRTKIVKIDVELPRDIIRDGIIIEDLSGNTIPSVTLSKSDISPMFDDQDVTERQRYSCVVELRNIPAMGYKTFKVLPVRKTPRPSRKNIITAHQVLENDFIRVTIQDNGTFTVYSKETGVSYHSLGYFADTVLSDVDDKQPHKKILSTEMIPTIKKLDDNMLLGSYKIEYDWAHEGISRGKRTKISLILSLDRLSRAVDINIDLVDKTENHQINYYFPIDFKVDHIYSDVRFDIQDVLPSSDIHKLSQFQVSLNTLVGVCDEIAGFAIISKELRSAAVTTRKDPHISMTILHKPGTRLAESETSMLNYTFAFYPYIGGWENGQILIDAYNKLYEIRAHMLADSRGSLPPQMEFLNISPSSLCFSALKTSENGNAVLRLFNPTVEFITGSVTTHYPLSSVYSMSLEEYRVEQIALKNDYVIPLLVPPKKIITLELIFKDIS